MPARSPSEAAPPAIGHNGGPTLNPVLADFWTTPARNRVLYGGRSSSKSWDAAGFAIFLADNYKVRFLCVRQFQNKVEESVYTLLKIQIERFGLGHRFRILDNKIINKVTGSEFVFYGLWRHIDEIKSLEGIDICWIEEAHGLTEAQWKILEPTLRNEASQFWIIFNPKLTTDFVYRRFVTSTPDTVINGKIHGVAGRTIKRKINYDENPFLSNTIKDVIATHLEENEEDFRHVYLGEPLQDDDQVIIKRSWLVACLDAKRVLVETGHYVEADFTGARRIGFDVADGGPDKNSTVEVYGVETIGVDEWKAGEDELLKSASRVHAQARERGAAIHYDSIGVGAFAGAHFDTLNTDAGTSISHYKFNAGAGVADPDELVDPKNPNSPTNRDYYLNYKAQCWWRIAGRARNTFNAVTKGTMIAASELLSINPDCAHLESLLDELSMPRRDFDNAGKVKVESKKDLAKANRIGGPQPSPNKADAFIAGNTRPEGFDVEAFMKAYS